MAKNNNRIATNDEVKKQEVMDERATNPDTDTLPDERTEQNVENATDNNPNIYDSEQEKTAREEAAAQKEREASQDAQKDAEAASKPTQNSAPKEDGNVYSPEEAEKTEEKEEDTRDLSAKRSELVDIVLSKIEQDKNLDYKDPWSGINLGRNFNMKKNEYFDDETEKYAPYYTVNGRFRLEGAEAKKIDEALKKNSDEQEDRELTKFLAEQKKPVE